MEIIDYITGEMISGLDEKDAIEEAHRRIDYHNSEFTYGHRCCHCSENATMVIEDNTILIKRKEEV